MSTRSTTHFVKGDRTAAIIYRHSDGYPEGAGRDISHFFDAVEAQAPNDTRFGDPSYLAAKYVVWLAELFAPYAHPLDYSLLTDPSEAAAEQEEARRRELAKAAPLNFLSVGVVAEDPDDIEYRYVVECGANGSRPRVRCYEVGGPWDGPPTYTEVEIP